MTCTAIPVLECRVHLRCWQDRPRQHSLPLSDPHPGFL